VRRLSIIVAVATLPLLGGCFGYRLIPPSEIAVPSYEPREVLIPAECERIVREAATRGVDQLSESEARGAGFCQMQQIRRAQEEEAAARKLESHVAAGRFLLQVTTVLIGATIAVLTWVF
jgi:hypothetical protein